MQFALTFVPNLRAAKEKAEVAAQAISTLTVGASSQITLLQAQPATSKNESSKNGGGLGSAGPHSSANGKRQMAKGKWQKAKGKRHKKKGKRVQKGLLDHCWCFGLLLESSGYGTL